MTLQFSTPANGVIDFTLSIPVDYRGPLLCGSNFLHATKDFGELMTQEIAGEHFSLHYNIYRFFQKITLRAISAKKGLHTRFMLRNNIYHSVKGVGKVRLREGQFGMLWSSVAECISKFDEDNEYVTLDIYYSPAMLQQIAAFFPELQTVLDMEDGGPLLLGGKIRTMIPKLKDIIKDILECPFDPQTSPFYFDLKAREFLFVMLSEAYNGKSYSRFRLTPFEKGRIKEVREILLKDITKKPPSIRELAKKISVNEFKLKKGFREIFGTSIFECLLEARMDKARELLLTTDLPIKSICSQVGYPRITNFITAFRRKYGYTPGSMRRK